MNLTIDTRFAALQQQQFSPSPPSPPSPPRCASRLAVRPPLTRGGMMYNFVPRSPTKLGIDDDDMAPCLPVLEEDEDEMLDEEDELVGEEDDLGLFLFSLPSEPRPTHRTSPTCPSALSPYRRGYRPPLTPPAHTPTRLSYLHRHLYPHRGLSRLGLAHVRGIWAARRVAWDRWSEEVVEAQEASLYGGITFQPSPSPAERDAKHTRQQRAPTKRIPHAPTPMPSRAELGDPPMSPARVRAFPRVGDLLTLRDPRGAAADWCFRRVPIWTLRKALWTHDLHERAASAADIAYTASTPDDLGPGSAGPASASTSSSSSSLMATDADDPVCERANSPDSDTTLVESDCGWKADGSSAPSRPWEENWLARWAVLANVLGVSAALSSASPSSSKRGGVEVRGDGFDLLMRAMLEDAACAGAIVLHSPPPTPRRTPRFFVGDESDEEEVSSPELEEVSDDEEEGYDYGSVVESPKYGRLRSQLERSRLAFAMMA